MIQNFIYLPTLADATGNSWWARWVESRMSPEYGPSRVHVSSSDTVSAYGPFLFFKKALLFPHSLTHSLIRSLLHPGGVWANKKFTWCLLMPPWWLGRYPGWRPLPLLVAEILCFLNRMAAYSIREPKTCRFLFVFARSVGKVLSGAVNSIEVTFALDSRGLGDFSFLEKSSQGVETTAFFHHGNSSIESFWMHSKLV